MENRQILVVDDEPSTIEIIIDILTSTGEDYDILQALDAETALEIAIAEKPDLILTDWEMPVMDGIAFIKRLKQKDLTKDIPVVMCTGIMTDAEHLKIAFSAGAIDFLRKPIDEIELRARVSSALELSHSYQKIKQLNEAKDDVFAIIANDLRMPVGNTKAFIDMVLEELAEYEQEDVVDMLQMAANMCGAAYSTLDNLLAWARSQKDNMSYCPEINNIYSIVYKVLDLLNSNINQKDIQLTVKVSPALTAYCDKVLAETVLRNLLSNAVKFTGKAGIVQISSYESEKEITMAISDTGIGIPPERQAQVLDKTTYKSTLGTDQEKGMGLGLKLSREFVEKHNGRIWFESAEGQGTSFYFTLPKHKPA